MKHNNQRNKRRIIKYYKPKVRRGKRKSLKTVKKSIRFLGVNAAGLKSKMTSFKKILNDLKPAVFFIEETKYQESGKIKLGNNFQIYELLRQDKKGGGLALGCLKELNPVWVREGNDMVEALSVEIFLKDITIRCCVAYGPQENSSLEKKDAFWNYLETEVLEAEYNGTGFVLHFDGNLWAGKNLIPGDPRAQNKNGKLLEDFLKRNKNLTIVNGLSQCKGLITRSRLKGNKSEESILDFFIVCSKVLPYITQMVIDEEKQYILTNYRNIKNRGKATDSDHFTQYLDLDLEFIKEKPVRQEIFDFKDEEAQKVFKTLTSETTEFTNCFKGDDSLETKIEKWREVLRLGCQNSFRKIRIKKSRTKQISGTIKTLIDKRSKLLREEILGKSRIDEVKQLYCNICHYDCNECKANSKHKKYEHGLSQEIKCNKCAILYSDDSEESKHIRLKHVIDGSMKCGVCGKTLNSEYQLEDHQKGNHSRVQVIDEINKLIADEEAKENRKTIMKHFAHFSENPEKIEMQKMWKVLKTISPKIKPPLASAKRNFKGKIISSQKDIKNLLALEYKNRLRTRPMRNDLKLVAKRKEEIFDLKMKLSKMHQSKPWLENDLEIALRDLKNNKSRDFEGYANEIFKNGIIGSDLKKSLLIMFNGLKKAILYLSL